MTSRADLGKPADGPKEGPRALLSGTDPVSRRVGIDDQALKAGAFGSHHVVTDGEALRGADRLAQIDNCLATGGF
jgi:2-hydroxychromene-2-carboxylate isomerase